MNIYDFAFEMEKDSETYYKNLANKATNEGFKKILTMLAVEEKKHQYYITELKKNNTVKQVDSTLLKDVKNIFASMRDKEEDISINVSQVELYQKAQELEKKTAIFYIEKSETAKSKAEKILLIKLASEEKKHYYLLDNIIEFVNRPATWLENAEFNHINEDY